MSDMTLLKHLTALRLEVSIWSARRKLTAADIAAPNLPPETLATLGTKKVCNPEDLRIFAAIRSRAIHLLDRQGVRFLGGWALPDAAVTGIIADLEALAVEFAQAKEAFLARYDEAVQAWIASNPGWEALLTGASVRADIVRSRLDFAWQMFRLQSPRKGDAAKPLAEAVAKLGNTLYGEVARVAEETWQKSLLGRSEVSLKALSPVRSVRQKLAGMSFVDPTVSPLLELIDAALSGLPEKGPLVGRDLVMLQGLVCLLRDPEAMQDHARQVMDGGGLDTALGKLLEIIPAAPLPLETPALPPVASLGLW